MAHVILNALGYGRKIHGFNCQLPELIDAGDRLAIARGPKPTGLVLSGSHQAILLLGDLRHDDIEVEDCLLRTFPQHIGDGRVTPSLGSGQQIAIKGLLLQRNHTAIGRCGPADWARGGLLAQAGLGPGGGSVQQGQQDEAAGCQPGPQDQSPTTAEAQPRQAATESEPTLAEAMTSCEGMGNVKIQWIERSTQAILTAMVPQMGRPPSPCWVTKEGNVKGTGRLWGALSVFAICNIGPEQA